MKYALYVRKSSESEDRQALSIQSQIDEMKRIAERENLEIVRIFQESKSAKNPGREKFNEMIEFIKQGKADAILCWKIDRLARNPLDDGLIKWLQQNEVIKQIKTFDRDYNADDNILLAGIEFSMANQYIRDLSKNVKRGNRAKLQKGEWPNMAPLGYLNENKKIIVDKTRARYIQKAFDLYATVGYSITEIADILFKDGFSSRKGYKYHRSKIHRMLTNPFYYGVMRVNGESYVGNHEPIISKDLFDKVQSALTGKHHGKKEKHFFAMRGFLKCEQCGCLLTPARKKGIVYFYCTNGKGSCDEHKKYLREKDLEKSLAEKFNDLKFDPQIVEIAYRAAKEKTNHTKSYLETAKINLANRLQAHKTKQQRLLDGYCEGNVAGEVYEAKSRELKKEEIDLKTQLAAIERKIQSKLSTLEQTKKAFLQAFSAEKEFLEAEDGRKRKLLEILLWNATFQNQEMAKVSYKMPFQLLADEPEKGDFLKLLRGWDLNPRPGGYEPPELPDCSTPLYILIFHQL